MGIRWIDEPPAVEIEPDGVRVTLSSGDETWAVRFSRATYRQYIERAKRALDDGDRHQSEVKPFCGDCDRAGRTK